MSAERKTNIGLDFVHESIQKKYCRNLLIKFHLRLNSYFYLTLKFEKQMTISQIFCCESLLI